MAPILIVDDEADLVATYDRVLRRKGYRLSSAGSPNAGLALVEQDPLALFVTDLRLPDGDGLKLIRRAVRRLPTPIPAIVATGFISEVSRTAALAAGAAGYLTRPFAVSTFAALVEDTLATRPREP